MWWTVPIKLIDHGSETLNEVLTPEIIAQLTGRKLKIDPEAADEGLFLVGDYTEFRVASTVKNTSELFFSVTKLLAEFYSIQVRKRIQWCFSYEQEIKTSMEVLQVEVLPKP